MVAFREGGLVKSLAGHDRNELYIIISVQKEYVSLSDGRKHPAGRPKRKNKKHLQRINRWDEEIKTKLTQSDGAADEAIEAFIRTHRQ